MKKLRLLDVSRETVFNGPAVLEYLSNELCFIRWPRYPLNTLPGSFNAKKLVYLHMPENNIVQLWKGRKTS
jgi:hypothetical protein